MHCNPKILSNISRKAIASFPRSTNCALGNIHTIVVPVGIKQQTVSKKTAPKFCCPTPVYDGLPFVLCMKLIKGAFLFTQFIPATNGGFNKTTSTSLKLEGTNDKISFVVTTGAFDLLIVIGLFNPRRNDKSSISFGFISFATT